MVHRPGGPRTRSFRRRLALAAGMGLALAGGWWLATGRPVAFGTLAEARAEIEDTLGAAFVVERVTLTTTAAIRLSCFLRRPASRAAGQRFAAVLVSGGIGTGRRAALLVDSAFAGLALSCDYPWRDPTDLSLPALLVHLPAIRARIVATPQALAAAADYLVSRPDVDTARFGAVGASLGVPGVVAWASRDPRPKAVALLYGGGDQRLIWDSRLASRIPSRPLRGATAAGLALLLRPLEPTRWVPRIAPRPLLLVNGADDEWIPRQAVEALYAAAGTPKRVIWVSGRHMRPDDVALLKELSDSTTSWLRAAMP